MLCSFSSPEKAPSPLKKHKKEQPFSWRGQYYFGQRGLFFNEENERGVFLRPELWHEPAPFRSLMLGPWGLLVCRHGGDSCRFSKKTYVGCSTKQQNLTNPTSVPVREPAETKDNGKNKSPHHISSLEKNKNPQGVRACVQMYGQILPVSFRLAIFHGGDSSTTRWRWNGPARLRIG